MSQLILSFLQFVRKSIYYLYIYYLLCIYYLLYLALNVVSIISFALIIILIILYISSHADLFQHVSFFFRLYEKVLQLCWKQNFFVFFVKQMSKTEGL